MTDFESNMEEFHKVIEVIEKLRDELNALAVNAKLALETITELKKERDECIKDIKDAAERWDNV
jgi:chromosome segregation ATPase